LSGKGPGRLEGVVAEELDDLGQVPQPGVRGTYLPVVDGGFVHPELLGYLGLEQAKVEPALAEVVAYRNYLLWIGLCEWFGRCEAEVATKQRNGATVGILAIQIADVGAVRPRCNVI
jgi:hypothetical protein